MTGQLSQTMIIIGFVLMLANTCIFGYHFLLRRDVMQQADRLRMGLTVLVFLLLLGICVFYVVTFNADTGALFTGVVMLANSGIVTVMLQWVIAEVKTLKENANALAEHLMRFVDASDENLDGHSLHVHHLCMLMYDYLPPEDRLRIRQEDLSYASLFLDLGKLAVPGSVLDKEGKLENAEWDAMRRHPEYSAALLSALPNMNRILDAVRYHHERMDGTGYYRKKGTEIPLLSRIIAVADTYSAITTSRTFKATLSYDEALTELKQARGTQLDPALVDLFCTLPKEKVDACLPAPKKDWFVTEGERP